MDINILAVIAAALSTFAIGGLWYSSALFGRAWMAANDFSEADIGDGPGMGLLAGAFVLSLIMAGNLAAFLSGPETTLGFALAASLAAGLGWAAAGLAIVALFERRGWRYIAINGGYLVVAFLVMGVILGLWR